MSKARESHIGNIESQIYALKQTNKKLIWRVNTSLVHSEDTAAVAKEIRLIAITIARLSKMAMLCGECEVTK